MDASNATVWQPSSFFLNLRSSTYGFMVLNTPINIRKDILKELWDKASTRVTVDGGTDRWLKWLQLSKIDLVNEGLPNLVTGDFDSINPATLFKLREKNVEIVETPDQDFTDFTKAVQYLQGKTKLQHIIVISETYGRIDQVLSQLNTLFLCEIPLVLLSSCSATWLLRPGTHEIQVGNFLKQPTETWASLMPVGAPATVTTSGLKWNLENTKMEFGGLVSSSNTYNGESSVRVLTDQPLVWSMSLSFE